MKKVCTLILSGLMLLSSSMPALALTKNTQNIDELYSSVYATVNYCTSWRTQGSINKARGEIEKLKGAVDWAVGEFSKQVDVVQHEILIQIVDGILQNKNMPKQSDIDTIRSYIKELPVQDWKHSYSSALDVAQNILISQTLDVAKKYEVSKSEEDKKNLLKLLQELSTSTNQDVKNFANTVALEQSVEVPLLPNPNTVDWSKKYPKLINPDKKDMKPLDFSPKINKELDDILVILEEVEQKFNIDKLNDIFNRIFILNRNMDLSEVLIHSEYDQVDYIMTKAIYLAFINHDDVSRDSYFIKLIDNMYLSYVRKFNSGNPGSMLTNYGTYIGYTLGTYFPNERTAQILQWGGEMMMDIDNRPLGRPEGSAEDDFNNIIPEDELPSNLKPSVDTDIEYEPDIVPNYDFIVN